MTTQGVKYNNYYLSDRHHTVLHSRQDKYKFQGKLYGHTFLSYIYRFTSLICTDCLSDLVEEELQIMKYGQYCNSLGLFPLHFHKHNDTRSITRRGISYLECK